MKVNGKITSAKYRNGTKPNSGDSWECVDYYLVEVNAQVHRSEFPFTLWNAKMRDYSLHVGAEGEFDVQVTNEVRNGYNNVKVHVNGFLGNDNGVQKTLGSYAHPQTGTGEPNMAQGTSRQPSTAGQPNTAAFDPTQQPNVAAGTAAFDPTNGGFGGGGEQPLPF